MNLRHLIATAALAAVASTGFAQSTPEPTPAPPAAAPAPEAGASGTKTPVINQREKNQDRRIQRGKESGDLTRAETRRLRAEQKVIDKAEHRAAADGTVTTKERTRIRHMQDRAGKDIARQRNDSASAAGK